MELLPDPVNDRFVKSIPPPPNKPLPESLLYPHKGISISFQPQNPKLSLGADKDKPDWKLLKDFLLREGPFTKQ